MAPSGLVDQWQDDSYLRFGLAFEIRTRQFGETVFRASAFDQHQPLIARMDQLSRNEELLAGLQKTEWDMVVPHDSHRRARFGRNDGLRVTGHHLFLSEPLHL
ncbi:MAG: hypothetical protein ABI355_10470 [Solirubrobacteraceae bacterium]